MNKQSLTSEKMTDHEWLSYFGGFAMAYSTLGNKSIQRFRLDNLGYIGYSDHKNLRLMIGDPLSHENSYFFLLQAFVDSARNEKKHVVAVQCGKKTADVFRKLGFTVQYIGYETVLNLEKYSTSGRLRTKVRRWINTAKNAHVIVQEIQNPNDETWNHMKTISDHWLKTKKSTWELSLMTRPPVFKAEVDTRVFCAYQEDKMIGFIIFDPLYEKGTVTGYYADICRNDPRAPNGTTDIIVEEARTVFKNEGIKSLSLGVSPLAGIGTNTGYNSLLLSMLLKSNYYLGNRLYSFKGLEFHKAAYHHPDQSYQRPVFYAVKGFFPVAKVLTTFNHIGIIQGNSITENLIYLSRNIAADLLSRIAFKFKKVFRMVHVGKPQGQDKEKPIQHSNKHGCGCKNEKPCHSVFDSPRKTQKI